MRTGVRVALAQSDDYEGRARAAGYRVGRMNTAAGVELLVACTAEQARALARGDAPIEITVTTPEVS